MCTLRLWDAVCSTWVFECEEHSHQRCRGLANFALPMSMCLARIMRQHARLEPRLRCTCAGSGSSPCQSCTELSMDVDSLIACGEGRIDVPPGVAWMHCFKHAQKAEGSVGNCRAHSLTSSFREILANQSGETKLLTNLIAPGKVLGHILQMQSQSTMSAKGRFMSFHI